MCRLTELQLFQFGQENESIQEVFWESDIVVGHQQPVKAGKVASPQGDVDVVELSSLRHRRNCYIHMVPSLLQRLQNPVELWLAARHCDAGDQDTAEGNQGSLFAQAARLALQDQGQIE